MTLFNIKALLRDRAGNFGIMTALMAFPLLAAAGMSIDYARLIHARSAAQSALDASLLGAVSPSGVFDDDLAEKLFDDNLALLGDQSTSTPIYTDNGDGTWSGRTTASTPLIFGNLIMPNMVSTNVTSKVNVGGGSTPNIGCLYTLSNQSQSFLQNSGAKIEAPWCTINVGTTVSTTQMTGFNSGFLIDVAKICVAGRLSYDNRQSSEKANIDVETECETPGDFIRSAAIDLASSSAVTSRKAASPVYSNWKSFNNNEVPKASDYSWLTGYNDGRPEVDDAIEEVVNKNARVILMEPGRYQSINFNSGGYYIILKPGLYVIDGTWNINGQDLIGHNVSLFFTENGKLQPNSGMGFKLTAPTTGDFKGMLLWEDPRMNSWQNWTVNDNKAESYIKGVVYLPNREYTFNSSAQATYSATFMVKKATLNGGSRMTFDMLEPEYTPENSGFAPPTTASASTGTLRLLQ